jgi:hypothetical protein
MLLKYTTFIKESKDEREINIFCKKHGIENYKIVNGVVNVDGDVDVWDQVMRRIPIQFGSVTGNFECADCNLKTLRGCPHYVGGNFICYNNNIMTLEGCPQYIGGDMDCTKNDLENLIGGPVSVGGTMDFGENPLRTLEGFPTNHRPDAGIHINDTPIEEIYELFLTRKCIPLIVEWDVIDPLTMEVSYLKLLEVYESLDIVAPQQNDITLENYTLVD